MITKDPAAYAAVLEAVRTDPEMRGKLMEIENKLALNAQKVMQAEAGTGNGFPVM